MLETYSEDELLEALGWRFREIRIEANVTQQELSRLSGVSRSTIARFEQGENITLKQLISLLQHTGRQDLLDTWTGSESPETRVRERVRKRKEETLPISDNKEELFQSNAAQGRLTRTGALLKTLAIWDAKAAQGTKGKERPFVHDPIDWLELTLEDGNK